MQLINKGQVSLSNEAQATVFPVPGSRQKKRKNVPVLEQSKTKPPADNGQ